MSKHLTVEQRLRKLYAEIPSFECIPGCTDCCGPVHAAPTERSRAPRLPKLPPDVDPHTMGCIDCPYSLNGRCDVWQDRPFICRLFGTVPGMACPHGRGPEKMFTEDESMALFRRYWAITGGMTR